MRECLLRNKENAIALSASFILAIVFGIKSPLHPWRGGEAATDSSVFKTVALMMERGYLPYKDSFDHKGPFVYLLNLLGNTISDYRGIWVIEVITLASAFYIMFKIARLSCGKFSSTITVLMALSLLFIYYEEGNYTEEYAMPFIAISIFVFLDYLINDAVSKVRLVVTGGCLGIVLMLRPNMISVWIVYCITITLLLLTRKEGKKWLMFSLWFILGLVLVLAPVAVWLAANNDLTCCIRDYIVFNLRYASSEGGRALFSAKLKAFFVFFNTSVFLVSFFSLFFHLCKEKGAIIVSYLVYLLSTIVLMVMSGMSYGHYGMILIPATIYPISLLFNDIEKISDDKLSNALLMLISLYLLSTCIVPSWINLISGMAETHETKNQKHFRYETVQITNMINELTEESDTISVYGNWDIIYVLSNRKHATRYSYQFPISNVSSEIMDEYLSALKEERPKIIVVQPGHFDESIQSFLENNNYKQNFNGKVDEEGNSSKVFVRQ